MSSIPRPFVPLLSLPFLLGFLALAAPPPVLAQDAAPPTARAAEGPVRVLAVDPGRRSLSADDLQVVEGGSERPVLTVVGPGEPSVGETPTVIWIDLALLTPAGLLEATTALGERARELTELGPVEILVADREVTPAAAPTDDPASITETLSWLGLRQGARDRLGEIRRAWLEGDGDDAAQGSPQGSPRGLEAASRARQAIAEEAELLRDRRELLVSWAADRAEERSRDAGEGPVAGAAGDPVLEGPGVLVLVTGAADEDPSEWYRRALTARSVDPRALGGPGGGLDRPVVLPSSLEVGRVLSAYGWSVVALLAPRTGAVDGAAGGLTPPTLSDMAGRPGDPTAGSRRDRPALITPDFGRGDDDDPAAQIPLLLEPEASLEPLAEATGGEVVTDPLQLATLLPELGSRARVTYRGLPGALEPGALEPGALEPGALEPGILEPGALLEVEARAGRSALPGRRWVSTGTPETVPAVRARRLLTGRAETGRDGGDLPVEAALEVIPGSLTGRLVVRVEPAMGALSEDPTGVPSSAPRRITVGLGRGAAEPLVFHQPLTAGELLATELDGSALYSLPVTLTAETDDRVVVLVDEPLGGAWGGSFAAVSQVERFADLSSAEEDPAAFDPDREDAAGRARDGDALPDILPAPQVVHLVAPDEPFVFGQTSFSVILSDPQVGRVDFFLDGELEGRREAPPWTVRLDLGDLPRSRRLEAVAYDAGGTELGRDRLMVNEGSGSFRVRIVEPDPAEGFGEREPRVGPVDVVAEVTVPGEDRIDRLEYFWTTEPVATRYAPPWRQRVTIPEDAPQGFLRVVAYLEDGTSTEDVLFVNGPGGGERLEVDLVELYVVVTDRRGRPVTGLGPEDFRVYEEGDEQEVATFSDGPEVTLNLGLALDSSASMFVKLPAVGRAAGSFVTDSLEPQDRAFLVGFGGEPQLVQAPTVDRREILAAIGELTADGQTALWESVVFSLVQLQGAPGKKALIVYTDGADEDEDFDYRTALRFTRRLGVPVYFILTNNEIVRTGGRGLGIRRFLGRVERLAESVGGRVYLTRQGEDLARVYEEIGEELRNQYLLAYYPQGGGDDTWRRIRVEVLRPGLEARTIAGYYR